MQNNEYDVAIIGGGPAGLQAALVLARTRKRIVLFDEPQLPRNGASHGVHNFLGVDGLRPAEIREIAWKQIDVYGSTELCHEQVMNIEKGEADYFYVTADKGTAVRATHVILAFGYRDVHPTMAGFAECWADTIIPCPFCDGYENRDRVWGIVASADIYAYHFPKMVQNWTSHIKLLLQANVLIDSDYRNELIAAGISVYDGDIVQIDHVDGKVNGVLLDTGERIAVGTLLWVPPKEPLPLVQTLVENLGLVLDENGFVRVDEAQRTNVGKLWAAGDVQNGRSGALDAAYTGAKVAHMIVKDWYS